jgi:intracellular septation protein
MSFTSSPKMSQGTKLLIELGPLVAFFIANWKAGIFWGTGIFMVATAIALSVSWALTRKIAMVPLVSAIFVALFGALTLWLHSDLFIKVKVTLINALFGAVLLGGVAMGRSYIKLIMGEAVRLTEEAWRTLSIRWGVFFFAMAGLNEIVWRSFSTDAWVNFKVFGLLPITLIFALANAPYMTKHMIEDDKLGEDKAEAQ